MKIYLAGSIPKGEHEAKDFLDWRETYARVIANEIPDASEMNQVIFNALEGDSLGVAGADCLSIRNADLIIVNAEEKLGAGTAMELVIAKYLQKPVITVLPKNSHHRRSNITFAGNHVTDWIHPFIDTFSDVLIENISEIKNAVAKVQTSQVKSITIIDEAIKHAEVMLQG